jgi:UDP-N-acetylmuramoyl-tripeptide--D-alanyl-D-alanine ligase
MEARKLQLIAEACGGELLNGNPGQEVLRVSTDSRKVEPGDLFVALKGDRFDAHDFLTTVFQCGATAALVERNKASLLPPGVVAILVENTRQALGQIASRYRKDFNINAIAIGGSNGKTSTKEIVACVLKQGLSTLWNQASFNNDIGVPLTLLGIENHHEAGVFEVGTNHPGELKPLVEMIRPQLGIITSIGREHLEFFGDVDGVLQEEGWLAELLPATGTLFVFGDSAHSEKLAARTKAGVVRIGYGDANDWRVIEVRLTTMGTSFTLMASDPQFSGQYKINLLGRHQVLNAAYSIALGARLGLSRTQIQRGLDLAKPAKMRLEVKRVDNFIVLDDSYNANADSVRAALETLREFPCDGRRIAVLGDMGELGEHTIGAHREVGEFAARSSDILLAIGKFSGETAHAARGRGMRHVFEANTVLTAVQQLETLLQPADVVLVKASRSSRLEQVVDFLIQRFGTPELAAQ